ncbi:Hypothetical predicted protein [Pelobates cultripes]|uniref:Uncharacterized protein n=1 Tax=Pelobates cultripes TaxID=61616 RepID=A0AAD1WUP1_PELCU|nr:Hypothetical predicted protein [Pelobates cultripes]
MADMPTALGNHADLGSPDRLECITDRFDKMCQDFWTRIESRSRISTSPTQTQRQPLRAPTSTLLKLAKPTVHCFTSAPNSRRQKRRKRRARRPQKRHPGGSLHLPKPQSNQRQVPRHSLHPGGTRTRHARQITGGGCGNYARAADQSALDYAWTLGQRGIAIWDSIHEGSVHRDCMKWPCRGIG